MASLATRSSLGNAGTKETQQSSLPSCIPQGRQGRTREDNIRLHCIANACKEVSLLWDNVRIFLECGACTVQVMRLGEAEAVRHCVRKIREMEGKE